MNIKSIADSIGLDYEMAMEEFCGDVSALGEKLISFPKSTSLAELESAINEGRNDDARTEARKLRKNAEKIGLRKLAESCSELEKSEDPEKTFLPLRAMYISIVSILGGAE